MAHSSCRSGAAAFTVNAEPLLLRADDHARAARRAELDIERRLENLLEQFALIDTLPACQRADICRLCRSTIWSAIFVARDQLVGHDHHRVAIRRGQPPQRYQKFDLRADIEMQRGFVKQQKRLLRERTGQDDALFSPPEISCIQRSLQMLCATCARALRR